MIKHIKFSFGNFPYPFKRLNTTHFKIKDRDFEPHHFLHKVQKEAIAVDRFNTIHRIDLFWGFMVMESYSLIGLVPICRTYPNFDYFVFWKDVAGKECKECKFCFSWKGKLLASIGNWLAKH